MCPLGEEEEEEAIRWEQRGRPQADEFSATEFSYLQRHTTAMALKGQQSSRHRNTE